MTDNKIGPRSDRRPTLAADAGVNPTGSCPIRALAISRSN
jgi:hypothetical protein